MGRDDSGVDVSLGADDMAELPGAEGYRSAMDLGLMEPGAEYEAGNINSSSASIEYPERLKKEHRKIIEDYLASHWSAPLVVLESLESLSELGYSDEETEEMKNYLLDTRIAMFYFVDSGKIYIFADRLHSEEINSSLVHENVHAICNLNGAEAARFIQNFYNALRTCSSCRGWFKDLSNHLERFYPSMEVPEEFLAYTLEHAVDSDKFLNRITKELNPSDSKYLITQIIDKLNGKKTNIGRNAESNASSNKKTNKRRVGRVGEPSQDAPSGGYGNGGERGITDIKKSLADYVRELCGRLHLDNVDIVEDASGLQGRRARAKGWYSRKTGRITIVLSNNHSAEDVERTLLHEAVAHYGLRRMFGKEFNTFLDKVYSSASPAIRRRIAALAAKNGWDFRTATEEYLASLAEDTRFEETRAEAGWWSKVKSLFKGMLASIGLESFAGRSVKLGDAELRYILWASYENLKGNNAGAMGVAADVAMRESLGINETADLDRPSSEADDLFRDGDFSPRDRAIARDAYNRMCKRGGFQFREAMQDSMAGLKALYQAILGKRTRIEDVAGFENAYLYENRMSSANAGEQYEYFVRYP